MTTMILQAIKTLHKELGDIRDKLSPRKRFKFTRECKRAEDAEQEVEVKEAEDEAEQFVIGMLQAVYIC